MTCKICNSNTKKLFTKTILNKYKVSYCQCENCLFIQTEKPYWLNEAYSSAITTLDIGLVQRNLLWRPIVTKIINRSFNKKGKFLDYGGGYGLFVRLLRDEGLDFYRQDLYCDNLFAQYFDLNDLPSDSKFELLTAFEVFEHLESPIQEIDKMFKYSDSILFSTEIQPSNFKLQVQKKKLEDWHYWIPETGQHIALFHYKTLEFLAKKYNKNLYSEGQYLHLLTNKKINYPIFPTLKYIRFINAFFRVIKNKFKIHDSKSLLKSDYDYVKGLLKK